MFMRRIGLVCLCILAMWGAVSAADEGEYRLATQDKITVTVSRHPELSGTFLVPPDGVIDFGRAGRLTVVGQTTAQVAAAVKAALAKDLREPEVAVALAEARPRYVAINGDGAVAKPGQYPLTPGQRLAELLAVAGGLVGEREKLTAHLQRGGKALPVDLLAVMSGNNLEANLLLQEGDILTVQAPLKITVRVLGQVKAPGVFRLDIGSTMVDALAAAGDLIDRPDRAKISLIQGITTTIISWADTKKVLQDNDVVLVEREAMARVYVNGHVKNPGAYELPEGGGVLQAITLAGGVLGNPALAQVAIVRRVGPVEHVDLTQAFRGIVTDNPTLSAEDQVIVPESTAKITVLGMVNMPGTFPFAEGQPMTVIDAISLAGGQVKKRAKLTQVTVIRVVDGKPQRLPVDVNAVLKNIASGQAVVPLQLKAGDIVYVPETEKPDWESILGNLARIGVLLPLL